MRAIHFCLAVVCCLSLGLARAAAISPDEQKLQTDFNKSYNNPDKDARKAALPSMEATKHSSSWAILDRISKSDPDPEVRLAAYTSLSKVPARDGSVSQMLAATFNAIKINDTEMKIKYAQAMATHEFKAQAANAIGETIAKMRYPDIPRILPGGGGGGQVSNNPQAAIDRAKKDRTEFEEMLTHFNSAANSEIKTATKESPGTIRKWMGANMAKLAQTDRELADKYRKEDEEAAKAAKAAAKAAK